MYYSYYNNGVRAGNENRSELRIYGSKIASRFFGSNADFTWWSESHRSKIVPSIMYTHNSNPQKYTKEIQEFLLREPHLTEICLVIRNPLDRLKTGLAQILKDEFDLKNITDYELEFDKLHKKIQPAIINDSHLDTHHKYLYNLLIHRANSNLPSRLHEKMIIEDIDTTKYAEYFYMSKDRINSKISNQSYISNIEELIDYIMNQKKGHELEETINSYLETETDFYNKLLLNI